tara:strand:+ start:118 stop:393 length:276 start_codon:yes stop_codon:yes gene_type:complete
MNNVRILNEGLHRIGLVLGFLSLIFLPDIFFSIIFDDWNDNEFFWFELWELTYKQGYPLIGSSLGVLSASISYAAGYFSIKIVEWIYRGFI